LLCSNAKHRTIGFVSTPIRYYAERAMQNTF